MKTFGKERLARAMQEKNEDDRYDRREPTNYWADCRDVFGLEWKAMSLDDGRVIIQDIKGMTRESDSFYWDNAPTFKSAAIELRRRIGGPVNLRSYCDTLHARANIRKAIP